MLAEEIKGRRMMLRNDPGNVALRDDLLLMLTAAGRLAAAADEAAASPALQPSSAAAHYNLGAASMAVGRLEQARSAFENATAIDPDHVMALYNLAILAEVSERAAAVRRLRRALALRPGRAAAESSLAWHLARGDAAARGEALTVARTAVERTNGRDLAALDVLAPAQAAASQFAAAAATIRQALAILPSDATAAQVSGLRKRLEEYERAMSGR